VIRTFLLAALTGLVLSLPARADNLLPNGDLEQGLAGWNSVWSRNSSARAELDQQEKHGGRQAVRVKHTGQQDWSLGQAKRIKVKPGEIYELACWMRVDGNGEGKLSVVLQDAKGEAISWTFGGRSQKATNEWQEVRSRFLIPKDAASIWPRLTGNGPATVWLDDASLRRVGSLDQYRVKGLPASLKATSSTLEVTLQTGDLAMTVVDRRTGRKWEQRPNAGVIAINAKPIEGGLAVKLLYPIDMLEIVGTIRLDANQPELVVQLAATGPLSERLAFPSPFVPEKKMFLVLPVNEGISYPVDDESLKPMSYHLYGGHGLCMPWYGMTDGKQGVMNLVETPNDAWVDVPRQDGLLTLAPQWQSQKGQFGYPRRVRYAFFDDGGYVAMCKRYRQYAKDTGLFKTLAEKREKNRYVDQLVGAANIWSFGRDPVAMCREMQSLGMTRILWSAGGKPEQLRQLNEMNVLTSRYDIYQDAMNPANFPKLSGKHNDWTSEAWPHDLMLNERGDWIRGWEVKGKDGQMYPCGVLCDRQAVDYARRRISAELKIYPYHCRFIDTTTASSWRECYSPDHPCTRTESRKFKMDLLGVVCDECGLVTGSETGHDAAVPVAHYFEGMLSLGPYRVPDSGRNTIQAVLDVPERVAKFQTGHFYRLPLWELVYHDCVVAQWYWGDYNNKLPSLWDRRDLWNALYGTPPMYMFTPKIWNDNRDRFIQSYKASTPVARATGYAEMLSHRWLSEDHSVQETQFANGVKVTVNFGDKPYTLADGSSLAPLSQRVEGLK
jgi:hypothetical protein